MCPLYQAYLVLLYSSLVLAQNGLPKFQQFVPVAICPSKLCEQKPTSFEFQFVSSKCAASKNSQGDKFKCNFEASKQGKTLIDRASRKGAHITFTDAKKGTVYFDRWVKLGRTFRFNSRGNKFPSDMIVEIYSGSRSKNNPFKLQSIQFHSSCSKNLYLGDTFGGVKLVGLYYRNAANFVCDFTTDEPSPSPSLVPSVTPTSSPSDMPSLQPSGIVSPNPSSMPSEFPSIKPSDAPSSEPSSVPSVQPSSAPSSAPSVGPTAEPSGNPFVVPSLQPSPAPSVIPSLQPSPAPSVIPSFNPTEIIAFVDPNPCTPSICRESPKMMTFEFLHLNGQCSSSSNSQDSDKFQCTDNPINKEGTESKQYYIIFHKADNKKKDKKKDKKVKKKKDYDKMQLSELDTNDFMGTSFDKVMNDIVNEEVYFSDYVEESAQIEINADAIEDSNKMKIPSDMTVKIYSVEDEASLKLMQVLMFHSSCSQNLFINDSFGSIRLVGLEYKDGTVEKCP